MSKSFRIKIEEALKDDMGYKVDPQVAFNHLSSATNQLGIKDKLLKNKVRWFTSNSNGDVILFFVDKVPAFQVLCSEILKPDILSSTLRKLISLSDGKSPDNNDIEFSMLDRKFTEAKKFRKQLDEMAKKIIESSDGMPNDTTR